MPILAALPAIAGIAGAGASIYSTINSGNAANKAANTQANAYSQAAANLAPWMTAGQSAVGQQLNLLGLGSGTNGGVTGQQSAIDALKQSPLYQSLYHNGEQAVLANGAATGGLRGGNTEASLYNLGVNTLAQTYQQQFNNLNGVSSLGQNAAAGVGNNQIGAGAASAGGILSSANANNGLANSIAGLPSLFGNSSFLSALGLGNKGGISGLGTLANAPAGVQSAFDGLF